MYETEDATGETKEIGYISLPSVGLHFGDFVQCGDQIKRCVKEKYKNDEVQVYCTATGYVLINKGEKLAKVPESKKILEQISTGTEEELDAVDRMANAKLKSTIANLNDKADMMRMQLKVEECKQLQKDVVGLQSAQKINPSGVLRLFTNDTEPTFAINNGEVLQRMACERRPAKMLTNLHRPDGRMASSPIFEVEIEDREGNKQTITAQLMPREGYLKKGVSLFYPLGYPIKARPYGVKNKLYWFGIDGKYMSTAQPEMLPKEREEMSQDNTSPMSFKNTYKNFAEAMPSPDYSMVNQLIDFIHNVNWNQGLLDDWKTEKYNEMLKHMVTSNPEIKWSLKDVVDFPVFFIVCMTVIVVFCLCGCALSVLYLINKFYERKRRELALYKKVSGKLKKVANRNLVLRLLQIQFDTRGKKKY